MKVTWRQLPTVLFEDEVLDKAFSRARKAADRVDDPNRVFRTRKQMTRMVQTAADIIHTMLTETVRTWPSLDQSPQFDVAMIEACVGTDDYRHHLSMCNGEHRKFNALQHKTIVKSSVLLELS